MMKRMLAGRSSIMIIVSNDCRRLLDGTVCTIPSILCIGVYWLNPKKKLKFWISSKGA
jgi:hypothetical protein